ncbi:MAG: hypothetical protein AB7H77_12205 [Bdellovibrionales bacterium]
MQKLGDDFFAPTFSVCMEELMSAHGGSVNNSGVVVNNAEGHRGGVVRRGDVNRKPGELMPSNAGAQVPVRTNVDTVGDRQWNAALFNLVPGG